MIIKLKNSNIEQKIIEEIIHTIKNNSELNLAYVCNYINGGDNIQILHREYPLIILMDIQRTKISMRFYVAYAAHDNILEVNDYRSPCGCWFNKSFYIDDEIIDKIIELLLDLKITRCTDTYFMDDWHWYQVSIPSYNKCERVFNSRISTNDVSKYIKMAMV